MKLKVIPKNSLIHGRFYLGRGRNGNVGRWDKDRECFLVPSWKLDMTVIKHEGHYDDMGCFQPFMLIEEGKTINGHRYDDILVL